MKETFDIAIVGAGPAGSALAHLLGRQHSVALIDKSARPGPRIGESLIPAARRLLRDMGLLDLISARNYPVYLGNRSAWGSDFVTETDFMRDPDGPGWHLDRADFEATLRSAARAAGARMLIPAQMTGCHYDQGHWHVALDSRPDVHARIVVDATGRRAALARMLDVRPVARSRTVAVWMKLDAVRDNVPDQGLSGIASCAEGWWYTAPLGEVRVLSLHTDADLLPKALRQGPKFLDAARAEEMFAPALQNCGLTAVDTPAICAANTQCLTRCAGPGWLAVGDAAMALDPLSSRGIFQALYTALAAATEIKAVLVDNAPRDFALYAAHLAEISTTYADQLDFYYRAENRWPDAPFWARRQA